MMEYTGKKEKISPKRLLSNIFFILRYAFRFDKIGVITVFALFLIMGLVYAWFDTYFIKVFIEMLQNNGKGFGKVVIYLLIGVAVYLVGLAVDGGMEQYIRARFMRIVGKAQEDITKKAGSIDLMCYDNGEYFDNYVVVSAQCQDMVITGILNLALLLQRVSVILGIGALIMTVNPVIAVFPVVGFVVNIITRFKITELEYQYEIEYKKIMRRADYSKRVFYQPEYAKELKLSNVKEPLLRQFNGAIDDAQVKARVYGRKIAVLSLINWIVVFTFISFFCAPLYLGYLALVKMSIKLSDVAAMYSAQNNVRGSLDGINYCLVRLQNVGQFAEKFRCFMSYQVQIENREGSEKVPDGICRLEFRNVSFRYGQNSKDILKNINMVIEPGEKVAIVGENGAGKTTFVKLLMGLYDVTEGQILYGGKDIRSFSTAEYRKLFGAVFQDYQIYAATLAENVIMDKTDGDTDSGRVTEALSLADFDRKLETMRHGTETEMTREFSDDGTMLSGGEAQKVAIARMFVKKDQARIAILDEPSSALDPLAEHKLNENMLKAMEKASVVFISHRLSTTKEADRIYLFENGEIAEQGTHKELMDRKGQYAQMFMRQAHYYQQDV